MVLSLFFIPKFYCSHDNEYYCFIVTNMKVRVFLICVINVHFFVQLQYLLVISWLFSCMFPFHHFQVTFHMSLPGESVNPAEKQSHRIWVFRVFSRAMS